MKLKYNVLWFEDDPDWFKSILPDIKDSLEEKGFEFSANRYSNFKDDVSILKDPNIDLILIDYNLVDQKGDEIITEIRKFEIVTDVIFYSTSGESILRKTTAEKGLDGVFCADRNRDDFLDKIYQIINKSIKKIEDVTNTRSLVVTETIDLENSILEILRIHLHSLTKEELSQLDEIKDNKIKRANNSIEKFNKVDFKDIEYLFNNEILSTNDVYDVILKYIKIFRGKINTILTSKIESDKKVELNNLVEHINSCRKILTTFFDEVIQLRNTLAHVKEETNSEGLPILRNINPSKPELIFDQNKYKEIRKDLRKHSINLNDINNILNKTQL